MGGLLLLARACTRGRATAFSSCYWPVLSCPWRTFCSASTIGKGVLKVEEVVEILGEVRAQDVKSIYVGCNCEWADYMVLATGKSDWHIRNIAQAILYNLKQRKKKAGVEVALPAVEGREGGKWLVIDTGSIIVHALHENARAYYDLDSLWTKYTPSNQLEELENSLKKSRRKRTNKKAEV